MEQTRLEKQWLENQLNQTIVQSANQANQSKDESSPDIDRVRELENELDTLEQRWLLIIYIHRQLNALDKSYLFDYIKNH